MNNYFSLAKLLQARNPQRKRQWENLFEKFSANHEDDVVYRMDDLPEFPKLRVSPREREVIFTVERRYKSNFKQLFILREKAIIFCEPEFVCDVLTKQVKRAMRKLAKHISREEIIIYMRWIIRLHGGVKKFIEKIGGNKLKTILLNHRNAATSGNTKSLKSYKEELVKEWSMLCQCVDEERYIVQYAALVLKENSFY